MKPTLYAYSELQKATKNFSADTKLGQGEYGAVYKVIQDFIYFTWSFSYHDSIRFSNGFIHTFKITISRFKKIKSLMIIQGVQL